MKDRLDKVLLSRGLALSRERAKALIMSGRVIVDGSPLEKAGAMVSIDAVISLKGEDIPYVSRGGLKLAAALKHFQIDMKRKVVMDVGISTGGFTDCMLQMGAEKVYGIDVGYGQLSWKIRSDPRVIIFERTNIRYLSREKIDDDIDFAAVDLSFISLVKVIPNLLQFLNDGGEILALVKPQFEVGKGEVDKGGVIRSAEKREGAVSAVIDALESEGVNIIGRYESPVRGQKGNIEYFIYLKYGSQC